MAQSLQGIAPHEPWQTLAPCIYGVMRSRLLAHYHVRHINPIIICAQDISIHYGIKI